jgi:hypothetical protein
LLYDPTEQLKHCASPVALEYFPAEQLLQTDNPVALEYHPAAHGVATLPVQAYPAKHLLHCQPPSGADALGTW